MANVPLLYYAAELVSLASTIGAVWVAGRHDFPQATYWMAWAILAKIIANREVPTPPTSPAGRQDG